MNARRWLLALPLVLAIPPSLPASPGTADPPSRRMALTFDDLPANTIRNDLATYREITEGLLEALRRADAPAVGFVNEAKLYVDGDPDPDRVELLRDWLESGLRLGNHTYSHPDLHHTPLDEFQEEILRGGRITRRLLAEMGAATVRTADTSSLETGVAAGRVADTESDCGDVAGRKPGSGSPTLFFRHPMLHTGRDLETKRALEDFLAEHGYRVAPVTIDNQEWIFARAYDHAHARSDPDLKRRIADAYLGYMDEIVAYYEQQSRALLGYELPQVLLLHANRLNADWLDELLETIRDRGYEFVTLDDALQDPAYDLPDEYTGPAGITWLHRWALTRGKRGDFFAGEPEVPDFVREAYRDPPGG